MKHLSLIILGIVIILSSCSTECDKTLTGTVEDAVTGEPLVNVQIEITGFHELGWIDYSNDETGFDVQTDLQGNFEIETSRDIISWSDRMEITGAPKYFMLEPEFATSRLETCGENHVRIPMHRLSHVTFNFFDDPSIDHSRTDIWTKFKTDRDIEDTRGEVNKTITIPVLEEIPNMIFFNNYDESGFKFRDTLIVEVRRGEIIQMDIGL